MKNPVGGRDVVDAGTTALATVASALSATPLAVSECPAREETLVLNPVLLTLSPLGLKPEPRE